MGYVAKAKPDGYTLLLALSSISIIPEADKVTGRTPMYQLDQFVADRALHRRSDGARGPRGEPVEDRAGVRRRRPQAARRDHLRLVGQLRHDAHPDGDVRGERRRQAAARALHRRRAGGRRATRRQRRCDVDRTLDRDPARQGGQGARAGVVGRPAARSAPRRPDADGSGIQRRRSSSGRRCSRRQGPRSRCSSSCAMRPAPRRPIRGSSRRWRRWKRPSSISTRRSSLASGRRTRRSSARQSGASARSNSHDTKKNPAGLPCGARLYLSGGGERYRCCG